MVYAKKLKKQSKTKGDKGFAREWKGVPQSTGNVETTLEEKATAKFRRYARSPKPNAFKKRDHFASAGLPSLGKRR
jgi:hypothetical protein